LRKHASAFVSLNCVGFIQIENIQMFLGKKLGKLIWKK